MNELCKDIKKCFEECGFKKIIDENKKEIYLIESELKVNSNDFKVEIMHHKKPETIIFQVKTAYHFNKRIPSKSLYLMDLINMNFMNIGCVAVNLEKSEIIVTSNLYLSDQGVGEYQFKSTLDRIFVQLQLCHDLVQKIDRDGEDPEKVISDFDSEVRQAMESETGQQFNFDNRYFVDIPKCDSFKDNSELVIMDMQLCLQDEGMLIMNEAERQTTTEAHLDKIIISWFKIECGVFQIQAFYTPEANIVGIEICGFPPIKDKNASKYIYLVNWINMMQMRNWWVLCPASNRVLLRGGFVISDGKLDKIQFRKLIKNSIENLKLFYPLVADQESIGKSVSDSILRFSGDNIIDIGRFHNN
ncbi:MAG: hypothetical protein K8S18_04325 [Desulfobacula sp.]|nr:hypothetical protein [Desulfobacula sp.]